MYDILQLPRYMISNKLRCSDTDLIELDLKNKERFVKQKRLHIKHNLVGYSFILPSLIGFFLFMAYPLLNSLFLSFMDWNMFKGLSGSKFIGFENYVDAFNNEYFLAGIKNNLLFVFMAVPALIVTSLILANLLNMDVIGRGWLRTMYFMPYIATITAAAVVFSALFHPEFGPINGVLRSIGIKNPPLWTASIHWALPSVALFWIWKNIGYSVVIYLAGLQGIPKSYYEAADIDGASKFQQFINITMPLVSPTTFFLVITSVIGSFQVFAEINVMTQGGPGTSTVTTVYHIYEMAFRRFQMGYASAVAWIFFFMVVGVTVIQWIGQKKWVNYD